MRKALGRLSLLLFFAFLSSFASADDQIRIPIQPESSQSIDLLYQGKELDKDQAAQLLSQGFDISALDPRPNDLWTPEPLPYTNAERFNYPRDGSTFQYEASMSASGFYRAQVSHNGRPFRLVIDMDHHQAQALAGLMRRLGYPVDSPQNYRKIKLQFRTEKEMEAFYYDMGLNTKFSKSRWVTAEDPKNLQIELQDVTIEYPRIEVPPYYWGRLSSSWLDGRRAARALIVPYALFDIRLSSYSINIFSWELGRVMNQNILLQHPYASAFAGETTFEDARWIARKIAKLNIDEWRAILAESQFPYEIQDILLQKLISRRNQMVLLFQLDKEPEIIKKLPFQVRFNEGAVVNGEVTQEYYPGYAPRFTVGDPESPLRWSELKHYLTMEGIAQAINAATSVLNKKLQILTAEAGQQKVVENLIQNVTDFCSKFSQIHPGETCRYEVPLKAWVQPLAGFNVSATRNLVTGTYYGSEAPAQLVDNISIGVNLGAFAGTTAIQGVLKNVGASVSGGYQRSYTHVRPVTSLEASKKEKWTHLFVPGFMKGLGKSIQIPDQFSEINPQEIGQSLKEFLDDLREGEVFTITDSYVGQLGPQMNIPLTALMGDPTGKLSPSVGIGASGDWVIMKRIMITRRKNRLEVYDSKINMRALSENMSLNVWFQLAKVQLQKKGGSAFTEASMIDLSPVTDDSQLKNPDLDKKRIHMAEALRSLLVKNESDTVQNFFPPIELDHELSGKLKTARALLWNWSRYDENHKVRIRLAPDPEGRFDPNEEQRTLYSTRKVRIQGKNPYGLVGQVLSKVSGLNGLLDSGDSLNSSNTFLGKSNWTTLRTEAELTPQYPFQPMMVLEDHYSGWSISKEKVLQILDHLTEKLMPLNGGNPLFRREIFNSTQQLQAYEIRSTTFIYHPGVEIIDNLLTEGTNCARGKPCKELLIRLLDLTNGKDLKNKCKKYIQKNDAEKNLGELEQMAENGNQIWRKCIRPWMRKMIKLSRKAPEKSDQENYLQWINTSVDLLLNHVDIVKLLNLIGDKNYFFQVRVSGFRTHDENGDQDYFSDTIGSLQQPITLGPFADLKVYDSESNEWQILDYELQARYFGNGL